MKTTHKTDKRIEEDLISLLKVLPEEIPSKDLSMDVMAKIRKTHPSFFEKLAEVFRHQITLSFSPVKAVAVMALLMICFIAIPDNFFIKQDKQRTQGGEDKVASIPPSANYFQGRQLLSNGAYEKSLGFFKQAVAVNPEAVDYQFWLGVNYGNLTQFQKERDAYRKAISIKPDHLMSLYFMGHSYMNEGNWDMAIKAYDKALSIRPGFEQAVFNKGLALSAKGDAKEAIQTWKHYLSLKKTGVWAQRAVARLNDSGDFSYRSYQIGKQKMVIGPFLTDEISNTLLVSDSSLEKLGESLSLNPGLDLFVIVYLDNRQDFAEYKAKSIKNRLLEKFSHIDPSRIKLSWFGVGENISRGKKLFSLKQSVRFLGFETHDIEKGVNT